MGCLKLNNEEYKRINKEMFGWRKKDDKSKEIFSVESSGFSEVQLAQLQQILSSNNKPGKLSSVQQIVAIVVGIISVIGTIATIIVLIVTTGTRLDKLEESVSNLVTESSQMSEYLYDDDGVKDQLGMINEALNIKVIYVTEDDTVSFIEDVSIVNNSISNTTSAFSAQMPVGVDSKGNVYIAEDLIGETVLLTYRDEGKDVFFLGQYNENYHWDGYCVTNTYNSDGTLYGICESNFNDGKRLDYKTVLCVDKSKNKWDYYHRICNDKINTGVSEEYTMIYRNVKNFTNTNVRIIDILYADKFIDEQEKYLTRYYYGNTSDGTYNDDTGNAYLVTYDEADGTVRTLYVGEFVNGYPHDKDGEAWNIAYADKEGYYVHNTGTFTKGYADKHSNEEFTHEDIEELISQCDFDCELKWK